MKVATTVAICVLFGAVPAAAQGTTATFSQWDLFAATGGDGTATQNVASLVRDANGSAGPQGAVWFMSQNPQPRLGRLDPSSAANNHLEWRLGDAGYPVEGAPLGLTINPANGDIWATTQGRPSVMIKTAFSNSFRWFAAEAPLIPQGMGVAANGSLYVALPDVNAFGQGQAIINVPRNLTSGSLNVTAWRFAAVNGAPTYIAVDASGNVWYTDRTNNRIGRLAPATDVTTEWTLPAGISPVGLQLAGTTACVISDGLAAHAGVVQCLDAALNRFTIFAPSGMDRPQQVARNAFGELFVTEWSGNAVVFVAQDAYGAATTTTVVPTTRTVPRGSYALTAGEFTVTPTTRTIVPSTTTMTGTDLGNGQVRFTLPKAALTYPFPLTGQPQPFGITAAFNDFEQGSGTAFLAEYFLGPHGRNPAARIDKLEVIAPRAIVPSAAQVLFEMDLGAAAPAAQTIAVTEQNGRSLDWTATSSAPWLTVTPGAGAAPGSIVIAVNPASLAVGEHTATITVDDGPAKASPVNIAVTLTITLPPTMQLSTAAIAFVAESGGMPTVAPGSTNIVTVDNIGGGELSCAPSANQSWVVIAETGACAYSVTLVDAPATTGAHAATISISSSGAANSPVTVAVTFTRAAPAPGEDTTPPVLTVPAGVTAEATAPSGATVTYTASAIDAVDGSLPVACTQASGSTFALGPTTVTCSATDASGNSAPNASFVVTVVDTTAPSLTVPANITVSPTSAAGVVVTYTTTASDLVRGSFAPECLPASGSTFAPGTITTVTCTAVDLASNTASRSFTITILSWASMTVAPQALVYKTGRLAYCNGVPVGPNWKDQGILVTNTGGSPLTVTGTSASAWIKGPSSATVAPGASATLVVSVDISGLSRGTYTGQLTLWGNGTSISTAVPVTLEIGNAPATMCLTPKAMTWGTVKGGVTVASQTYDILNAGDDPLGSWSQTKSITSGTLNVSALTGTGPKTITVSVKTAKKKGAQNAAVTITAPGAAQGSQVVTLTWTVR